MFMTNAIYDDQSSSHSLTSPSVTSLLKKQRFSRQQSEEGHINSSEVASAVTINGFFCNKHHNETRRTGPSSFYLARNTIFLTSLLCLLFLLFTTEGIPIHPTSGYSSFPSINEYHVKVPVGKLFTMQTAVETNDYDALSPVPAPTDPSAFPAWCRLNASNGEIYGIPQLSDVGTNYQITVEGKSVELEVTQAEQNWPCLGEQTSTWVEVFDDQGTTETTVLEPPEQYLALKSLHARVVANGAKNVQIGSWRSFTFRGLSHYRRILKRIVSPDQPAAIFSTQIVFSLHLSCNGELNEQANEIIDAIVETGTSFQVIEGFLSVKPEQSEQDNNDASTAESEIRKFAPLLTGLLVLILIVAFCAYLLMQCQNSKKSSDSRRKGSIQQRPDSGATNESEAALIKAPTPASISPSTGHKST